MNYQYYRIFENGKPLDALYESRRDAKNALEDIYEIQLQCASLKGYKLSKRLSHLPLRNTLGIRRSYADDSSENMTYVILRVKFQPIINKI